LNSQIKKIILQQFGAAIDMLENAIKACTEKVWGKVIGFKGYMFFLS
jgi:hypothetical protein